MPALSPSVVGTFVVSILLQIIGISLLPSSVGFSRPLPTLGVIVTFSVGIGLLARLTAMGVPLSVLLPLSSAVVPLVIVAVGVLVYGEPASLLRVVLLLAACLLIGVASSIR